MSDLIIALAEEIGDPGFFMGREAEMQFYLDWAKGTKRLHSKSQALLSRRKKGKTALVQRFYNILYSENDPQLIPFFYRVPELNMNLSDFSHHFYCSFLSQYLGFLRRDPYLINNVLDLNELKTLVEDDLQLTKDILALEEKTKSGSGSAWLHAQSAAHRMATSRNIRITQIIDEFQYMNRFVFSEDLQTQINLCHSYMGLAESKYAPLIVTGSCIGWLTTILNHMTARFEERQLGNLTTEEALATVYNYAGIMNREVTETTAAYIAEVAYDDPFYISQIIRTQMPNPNLTAKAGVRDALQFETTLGKGFVAKVWMEYVAEGIQRVNDVNGKKIVLYLARYGDEERNRQQIADDLKLEISDKDLADRLYMLKQADLIAPGSSEYRFKGLGDPIFEVIFRKRFSEEIENITAEQVVTEFEMEMKRARRQAAWFKGLAGEYKVMYHLLSAVNRSASPEEILFNPTGGFTLNGFQKMEKKTFHWGQTNSSTVDSYAKSTAPEDADLIAEVKTWDKPASMDVVDKFIQLKETLTPKLERKTAFLFYSENGFAPGVEQRLMANDVMYATFDKLTGEKS